MHAKSHLLFVIIVAEVIAVLSSSARSPNVAPSYSVANVIRSNKSSFS